MPEDPSRKQIHWTLVTRAEEVHMGHVTDGRVVRKTAFTHCGQGITEQDTCLGSRCHEAFFHSPEFEQCLCRPPYVLDLPGTDLESLLSETLNCNRNAWHKWQRTHPHPCDWVGFGMG